jgi:hypothetical protein
MSSLRFLLLAALVLACLAWAAAALAQAPVDWYTDTGSGGTLAQPARQAKNGGAVAPQTATGPVDVPESDISATPPISSPAQAAPVLGTPADEPAPAADPHPAARAAQAAPTVTGGEDQDSSASGPIAALPLTGLQLAGLAGAGLCLLVGGAVLRPRRHAAERG